MQNGLVDSSSLLNNKATPSQSLVSGPLQFMKSMRAGGRHIRTSGQEIATLFTMDEWLDNNKVMTSMNMAMQQAVYKSTMVLIKLDFPKGMRAVDQKLKINLVWPNHNSGGLSHSRGNLGC